MRREANARVRVRSPLALTMQNFWWVELHDARSESQHTARTPLVRRRRTEPVHFDRRHSTASTRPRPVPAQMPAAPSLVDSAPSTPFRPKRGRSTTIVEIPRLQRKLSPLPPPPTPAGIFPSGRRAVPCYSTFRPSTPGYRAL